MRLDHQTVKRQLASSAAALAAAALLVLAAPAQAQSFDTGAQIATAAANVMADVIPATRDSTFADAKPISATFELSAAPADSSPAADSGPLAADPSPAADDSVVAGIGALDDQTLSHQRGGAVGMLMVAATPQLMHGGNSVTLWDEIAPPAPLPIPVDSSQAAQGNVASYTRR
ncbi:hypothetical protein [Paraburkholderia sp. J12]|uniref:hypothetical protein n=1 Tax=Paraburkholderia sp. J12 TaxID=2805432 RepID=UPI002ABD60BB|nr:hypothetical protein [Paraburkholderia sp. J12]